MGDEHIPSAVPKSRTMARKHARLSLVWIIPVLAGVVGVWVGINHIRSEGPEITIRFHRPKDWKRARPRFSTRVWTSARSRTSGFPTTITA